uniref:Uncharacterized protein n=1 Tax=Cacopsylla melanoneura TaxID=428564 RepID=A0A8D9DTP8_9HEMI
MHNKILTKPLFDMIMEHIMVYYLTGERFFIHCLPISPFFTEPHSRRRECLLYSILYPPTRKLNTSFILFFILENLQKRSVPSEKFLKKFRKSKIVISVILIKFQALLACQISVIKLVPEFLRRNFHNC